MSNIAIITARGGSKGLKRKNILQLNDKPLIAWTIEAALNSVGIDTCYVSTEDEEIANISKDFGAKIIERPIELAQDNTLSEEVLAHAISYLNDRNVSFDTITLLQPTSPLRTHSDLDSAFNLFKVKDANCVISVFEPNHSAAKAYKELPDGSISGLLSESAPYSARQTLPSTYQPNGAIYIFKVDIFNEKNRIPREKVYPYVMPENLSIDIDSKEDFDRAQSIMRNVV